MDILREFIDLFLHLDEYLANIIQQYGTLTYLILFAVIFVETGLVIMPFLPGDSLLFAAGAMAALPETGLNIALMWLLLFVAAVLGDTVNYWIGNKIGPRVFERESRFIRREHLEKTQRFYKKHGGKTIIMARFVPIIRTFAPFVAGVGTMNYSRFITYNVVGGFVWVTLFLGAGYFFGNIPFVRDNFETVILAIIGISLLPPVYEFLKDRRENQQETAPA